ncbi:MAG TPA: FmdB family zinc ribbon protein [Fimbriimonas sp.]
MPTYVYECDGCRQVFEVWQRMADDPLTDCPESCGGQVKRIIHAPLAMTGLSAASAPDRPRFT